MRVLWALFLGMLVVAVNAAWADPPVIYKVEVVNLTKGQLMTPPVAVVHHPNFSLFKLGEAASAGLQELAKDGETDPLGAELDANNLVLNHTVGSGVIDPGATQELTFPALPWAHVSLASMLATTNDAFVGLRGLPLDMPVHTKKEMLLYVYDAGAETNNESCAYIPGPPCNNPDQDTAENEGFVHLHPGLTFVGDLDPIEHAFASIAAKVVVTRVK